MDDITQGVLYELCRAANPVPDAAGRAYENATMPSSATVPSSCTGQDKAVKPSSWPCTGTDTYGRLRRDPPASSIGKDLAAVATETLLACVSLTPIIVIVTVVVGRGAKPGRCLSACLERVGRTAGWRPDKPPQARKHE
ncbi:hypothetical protein CCMA1212_008866 [Trichoderma ghanense]|uniref:Uncharacterized protein n=1 Tax=Trichoderma ghanense TaxID=65468 RepID=A0ABY2GUM0_9HYPO